jgi:hypothetical protein
MAWSTGMSEALSMARESERQHNDSTEEIPGSRKDARARIETQIHRRSKAKAVLPLEAEWQAGAERPLNLKMPADKMDKPRNVGR